jgi:hypothetical protein
MSTADILHMSGRRQRRGPRRPPAKGVSALVHWHQDFPRRSGDFDLAIIPAWCLHCVGIISSDAAGEQHHQLIEQRDGRPVT